MGISVDVYSIYSKHLINIFGRNFAFVVTELLEKLPRDMYETHVCARDDPGTRNLTYKLPSQMDPASKKSLSVPIVKHIVWPNYLVILWPCCWPWWLCGCGSFMTLVGRDNRSYSSELLDFDSALIRLCEHLYANWKVKETLTLWLWVPRPSLCEILGLELVNSLTLTSRLHEIVWLLEL